MDKEKLFLYKIDLGELGIIYSPIIEDILQMGQREFYKLIYPFIIDIDDLELIEELKDINKFDLIVSSRETVYALINSLKYFYKTDDITCANNIVMINIPDEHDDRKKRATFITRNNFDE